MESQRLMLKDYHKSGVYCIEDTKTGRRYVGQATCIGRRWESNRKDLNAGRHVSEPMQDAWKDMDRGRFVFSLLEECEHADLLRREAYWIWKLKPEFNKTVPNPDYAGEIKDTPNVTGRSRNTGMCVDCKRQPRMDDDVLCLSCAQYKAVTSPGRVNHYHAKTSAGSN